jgi:hypothetical protein
MRSQRVCAPTHSLQLTFNACMCVCSRITPPPRSAEQRLQNIGIAQFNQWEFQQTIGNYFQARTAAQRQTAARVRTCVWAEKWVRMSFGPLLDKLSNNTHLHTLDVDADYMSRAFARDRVLPTVRACPSLRDRLFSDRGHHGGL